MPAPDKFTTDEAALKRLEALASDPAAVSKAAHFRRLYVGIEAALSKGVSYETVRNELKEVGLDLSPSTFKNYLLKERRRVGHKSDQNPQPPPATKAKAAATPPPAPEYGSHDPRAIDAILNTPVDLEELARIGRKGKL